MDNKLEERLRARLIRDRGHRGPLFEYKADTLCTEAADEITRLNAENERLKRALEPFAAMGRVMEARARITFGKVPKDSEIVCESSGEVGMGILTMGHFRDAAALLPKAPGWGGRYTPPFDRALIAKASRDSGHG